MKDERIEKAIKELQEAKEGFSFARKVLEEKKKQVGEVYTQLFEENVCKKGERLVIEEKKVDGFFREITFDGSFLIIKWSPMKKDGKKSNVVKYIYGADRILKKLIEKQQ